jgi:hypothetical protein
VPSQNADTAHAFCAIQTGAALVASRISRRAHALLVTVNQGEFALSTVCQFGELNIGILVAVSVHDSVFA